MTAPVIGRGVPRREDERLLTGRGRFTDDIAIDGEAHAAFVRAPYAHAAVERIDTAAARAMPGIIGVFAAADLEADGVRPIPTLIRERGGDFRNGDGTPMADPPFYPLARDRVRHAGEAVAVVVADTAAAAQDAAEAVSVAYDPLPAVTATADAGHATAPQLWPDAPRNRCFDWQAGDRAATDAAFDRAAHVISLTVANNRLVTSFLEPRAVVAAVDPVDGRLVLRAGTQSVHQQAALIAATLGLPEDRVRAITEDVGGGFGSRLFAYPEHAVVAWAARRLGRAVRWCASRSEAFLCDLQARDHVTEGSLALDADGRFAGLRVRTTWNIGAYVSTGAPFSAYQNMTRMVASVYATPAIHFAMTAVFTNTTPVNVYRGVGRAEAIYIMERLIDRAAAATGIDRAALRRRNLVPASAMPYTTPTGAVYDCGDFARNQDRAVALADVAGFAARRAAAGKCGRLRGLGIVHAFEGAGGVPPEYAKVSVDPAGIVELATGSQSSGQAHETTFAQVVADALELPMDAVRVVAGDTDRVASGIGTFASRSMIKGGSAAWKAGGMVIEAGRQAAAQALEAAAADVVYAAGRFTVAGTDRGIGLFELANRQPLAAATMHEIPEFTFPNGCHVCEVEVDPETGAVAIDRYTMVDDVGRIVNPPVVHGQAVGSVVQGLGQALLERVVHDGDGQPLTGSYMDYALPRADDLPSFVAEHTVTLTKTNPLGVKGAGEGGTVGAPPALVNAVLDALAPLGVTHIDMPATPETVWRAIRAAR
ncbi:MAG: xanthine dehydrogenase family protein molybdopterin-binding subunit [Rhodospirillales bacterium]